MHIKLCIHAQIYVLSENILIILNSSFISDHIYLISNIKLKKCRFYKK